MPSAQEKDRLGLQQYTKLKKECKERGLKTKGKANVLRASIRRDDARKRQRAEENTEGEEGGRGRDSGKAKEQDCDGERGGDDNQDERSSPGNAQVGRLHSDDDDDDIDGDDTTPAGVACEGTDGSGAASKPYSEHELVVDHTDEELSTTNKAHGSDDDSDRASMSQAGAQHEGSAGTRAGSGAAGPSAGSAPTKMDCLTDADLLLMLKHGSKALNEGEKVMMKMVVSTWPRPASSAAEPQETKYTLHQFSTENDFYAWANTNKICCNEIHGLVTLMHEGLHFQSVQTQKSFKLHLFASSVGNQLLVLVPGSIIETTLYGRSVPHRYTVIDVKKDVVLLLPHGSPWEHVSIVAVPPWHLCNFQEGGGLTLLPTSTTRPCEPSVARRLEDIFYLPCRTATKFLFDAVSVGDTEEEERTNFTTTWLEYMEQPRSWNGCAEEAKSKDMWEETLSYCCNHNSNYTLDVYPIETVANMDTTCEMRRKALLTVLFKCPICGLPLQKDDDCDKYRMAVETKVFPPDVTNEKAAKIYELLRLLDCDASFVGMPLLLKSLDMKTKSAIKKYLDHRLWTSGFKTHLSRHVHSCAPGHPLDIDEQVKVPPTIDGATALAHAVRSGAKAAVAQLEKDISSRFDDDSIVVFLNAIFGSIRTNKASFIGEHVHKHEKDLLEAANHLKEKIPPLLVSLRDTSPIASRIWESDMVSAVEQFRSNSENDYDDTYLHEYSFRFFRGLLAPGVVPVPPQLNLDPFLADSFQKYEDMCNRNPEIDLNAPAIIFEAFHGYADDIKAIHGSQADIGNKVRATALALS